MTTAPTKSVFSRARTAQSQPSCAFFIYPRCMRLSYRAAAVLCLPLFAAVLFAQTSQQSSQQPGDMPTPTGPAQQAQQTSGSESSAPAPSGPPAPLVLHNLTPEPHTPSPAELKKEQQERLITELSQLATREANWGPAISHPGMSLTLKEIGRKPTPNGTLLSYHILATGYTPDMRLTLFRWPLDGQIEHVMSGIVVNSSGLAVCGIAAPGPSAPTDAAPTATAQAGATQIGATQTPAAQTPAVPSCTKTMKPGTPITITATVAKGEPIRIALVASDKKHGAAARLIPFPIEGSNNGCKLDVMLGSKNAALVLVEGSGFKQDATYTLGSESYGQKSPMSAKIKPDGHFVTGLLPDIAGHPSGTTVVYYQSATCTPTVSFDWGAGSYKAQ